MSTNAVNWTSLGTISNATATYQQFTHDLSSFSNIYIRLLDQRTTGTHERYVDDFTITATALSPSVSVSPTTLSGFSYVHGSGPSTPQTFTVSGANLTSNISIAASTNYEISLSTGSGYTTPITLTQSGGTVSSTTIHVRLKPGLAVGNYNSETIEVTSTGATAESVICSGSVTPVTPAIPVALPASDIEENSFTANWNSATGAQSYRLDVFTGVSSRNASDLFISEYVEGSSNNKYLEIFNGTGASVDLSDYRIMTYYNGNASATGNVQLSGILAHGEAKVYRKSDAALALPVGVVAEVNSAIGFNGNDAVALFKISTNANVDIFGCIGEDPGTAWTDGSHTTINKTLVRKSHVTTGITVNPASGFPTLASEWDVYDVDTASYLGSHDFGGDTIAFVDGYEDLTVTATSQSVTGLAAGTSYNYRVRSYNTTATSANSNTITVSTLSSQNAPSIQASALELYPGANSIVAEWTPGNGVKRIVKINTSNSFTAPLDGTDPSASPVYSGSGEQVVYNGSTELIDDVEYNGVTITGLNPSTTYWVRVYEYNGSGTQTAFNTNSALNNPAGATTLEAGLSGYYNGITGFGNTLKTNLHNLLRTTHTTQYSYDALWTQLAYTDEDPNNTNNIIEIYTGWSVPKSHHGSGTTQWNREHTWSKSHGDFGDTRPAGTDLHHMRPCDSTVNSAKGNKDFDNGGSAYTDASPYSGYSGNTGCNTATYTWEPRAEDKGDVARMMMYMAVRYEGTDTTYNLELVDYTNSSPSGQPYYGKLSTLLQWHIQDPPDARELQRNERIFERQGNRNPFIDNPLYAHYIWSPVPGTATNVTETGFTINWSAPISASKYYLQVAMDNEFTEFVPSYSNYDAGLNTSLTLANLTTNTTYYYRLRSYFTSGYSMYSPVGSVHLEPILSPPDPPLAYNATAITHNAFTARWSEVPEADSYRLDVFTVDTPLATDLIISEYVEGTGNQKAIELFNGTGSPIDLSGYSLRKQINGAGAFGSELVLSGTLEHNATYVIVNSSSGSVNLADEPYVDLATTSGSTTFNGNDCIALYKNSVMIDLVGIIDQVENWGADVTLVRKSHITSPS
ncbi:MAG: endonuclease, partial [Candidatus Cloacimonadaceae bacterium]|nr:endonuclease [Candidatus Cloacimonadaceae bacterium]